MRAEGMSRPGGPEERWLEFPADASWGRSDGEVALVLDASGSAAPFREEIVRAARGVLQQLPGETPRRIFFLGNPSPYDASGLDRESGRWFAENEGRTSLIGPVFRALATKPGVAALVLGAGRVFDLDDWLAPQAPEFPRVFVRFGGLSLGTDARCREEDSGTATPSRLAAMLTRKREGIELSGPGWMPIFWDNALYAWDGQKLTSQGEGDLAVRVGLVAAEPDRVRPRVRLASEGVQDVPSRTLATPSADDWSALDDAEAAVFRGALSGAYQCPFCARSHKAEQLRCPKIKVDSILGTPVYRFIDESRDSGPWRGFGLLRESGGRVEYRVHRSPALKLSATSVAMRKPGAGASVHRFEPSTGRWPPAPGESVKPYTRLDDGSYVVVL